jgi:hypothetical protein
MVDDDRWDMNRRRFLLGLASSAVGLVAARYSFGQTAPSPVEGVLTIDETLTSHLIPANFNGLSYELAQLSDPDFFAASNKELIAYFRLLSPSGVLRLGGNSSESCWFVADAATTAPAMRVPSGPVAQNWMPHRQFAVLPLAIDHLAEFLGACGWGLIYGLNLGNSSPERAAREAEYVAKAIGDRLLYFQIGNEPNYYHEANNRTRPAAWGFDDYLREWTEFADAVIERVPGARFGGPDVAGYSPWVDQFAVAARKKMGSRLVAVTSHYYAEGPPDDPRVNISRLLRNDPKIGERAKVIADLAAGLGMESRMTEGNSCYRGGKPGMSDAFASALWAGDYMLTLAEAGYGGVNFHGGGASYLRASLGGHMPGDLVAQKITPAKGAYYTPIAGDLADGFYTQPIFYGMMFANQLAGGRVVNATLQAGDVNATAYAAKTRDGLRIAMFNKSEDRDSRIKINTGDSYVRATVWRLCGSGLDATSGVTLGGSEIQHYARWSAGRPATVELINRGMVVELPRGSGVVVFVSSDNI